jgi:hypothetical protein
MLPVSDGTLLNPFLMRVSTTLRVSVTWYSFSKSFLAFLLSTLGHTVLLGDFCGEVRFFWERGITSSISTNPSRPVSWSLG